jgi:uncharacterized membrane protein YgcG
MVFTGDWNGGERRFRVAADQRLELESIARIDDSGKAVPLSPGALSKTDQYAWAAGHTLRWRSRMPRDAPFEQTELSYRIDYRLSGILSDKGDGLFGLAHDFAFPDRPGVIEHFELHFDLDPVWETEVAEPIELKRDWLRISKGVVVTLPLRYLGSASSLQDYSGRSRQPVGSGAATRWAFIAMFLSAVIVLVWRLVSRERALGRFAPVPGEHEIGPEWIQQHILSMKAELVGALYHTSVGSPEVAALLARLEVEGKLSTATHGNKSGRANLELRLLVDRSVFVGYERALIEKLFFDGDQTSTERLRKYYYAEGLDPATAIRNPLQQQMSSLLGSRAEGGTSCLLTVLAMSVAVGLAIWIFVIVHSERRTEQDWLGSATLLGSAVFAGVGLPLAARFRNGLLEASASLRTLLVWLALGGVWMTYLLLESTTLSLQGSLALVGLGVSLVWLVVSVASSRHGAEELACRRRLLLARRYLRAQLDGGTRHLDDALFPYLVAFDLNDEVEAWMSGFAGATATRGPASGTGSSSASGAAGAWAGGGGRFGGGGAGGSWSEAVSQLAGGVAVPGSSASGSGGRGGSRSGGGGGGGW